MRTGPVWQSTNTYPFVISYFAAENPDMIAKAARED
jgi:hypothetical protein